MNRYVPQTPSIEIQNLKGNFVTEDGLYYLYRHIRPDKNEPLYIGIGKKKRYDYEHFCYSTDYSRSLTKGKRNKIWKDIVNKNNGLYDIEILLESDNYLFIKKKEIEFIILYGRINLKTGTLSNMTDGGDGTIGFIQDRYMTAKIVYVYDAKTGQYQESFKSTQDAAKSLKIDRGGISNCALGQLKSYKGFIFHYDFKGDLILPTILPKKGYTKRELKSGEQSRIDRSKITLRLNDNFEVLEELPALRDYCRKYGYKSSNLCRAIKNKQKSNGFYWDYKENYPQKIRLIQ